MNPRIIAPTGLALAAFLSLASIANAAPAYGQAANSAAQVVQGSSRPAQAQTNPDAQAYLFSEKGSLSGESETESRGFTVGKAAKVLGIIALGVVGAYAGLMAVGLMLGPGGC